MYKTAKSPHTYRIGITELGGFVTKINVNCLQNQNYQCIIHVLLLVRFLGVTLCVHVSSYLNACTETHQCMHVMNLKF